MTPVYQLNAPKRPVNLSLNEDLVARARALTGNLSERVEILLAGYVEVETQKRLDADAALNLALDSWNRFGEESGSFADEHSTL